MVPNFMHWHVQVDLSGYDNNDLCVADVMASNLLELNSGRDEKLRISFQDWKRTWEAKQNSIRNEIYQVIGFCIVFTAVAQSSILRRHNWWTAFLLSLWTSLVTVVVVQVVLQKLSKFLDLETTMASEKAATEVVKTRVNNVIFSVGPRMFDFRVHAADARSRRSFLVPRGAKLYTVAVVTVLLCFSAIFLVSSWRPLCKPGIEIPYQPDHSTFRYPFGINTQYPAPAPHV